MSRGKTGPIIEMSQNSEKSKKKSGYEYITNYLLEFRKTDHHVIDDGCSIGETLVSHQAVYHKSY